MEQLTHWKQNFNFKYTGAYELAPGEEKRLTISQLLREEVANKSGNKELCFVAYFKDAPKPMVLNKTNCKTIEKLYGPFIESWVGKSIIVVSRKVSAFGDEVDALRIKAVIPQDEKIDVEGITARLKACTTLDDLKKEFLSLKPAVQSKFTQIKDEIKANLSNTEVTA
jgi:hypothetical protein